MSPGCGLCHRKCVFFAGRSRPTTRHFSPSFKMLQFLARNWRFSQMICSQILYIVIVTKPFWSLGDNEIRVVIVKYKSYIENDCEHWTCPHDVNDGDDDEANNELEVWSGLGSVSSPSDNPLPPLSTMYCHQGATYCHVLPPKRWCPTLHFPLYCQLGDSNEKVAGCFTIPYVITLFSCSINSTDCPDPVLPPCPR